MHEFSIVTRILELALDVSRQHGNLPVERVTVEIGSLRQVAPDALLFAFEAASRGTNAEGAVFEWNEIPAKVLCERCEAKFQPAEALWLCPKCGAGGGRIIHGDELILKSVTLEE
ncbi:MAG: putative hydrogenase nickel incorporation protein HypA [Candidatus Hydrogenedentota bacterium]